MQIHYTLAIVAIILGVFFEISISEWFETGKAIAFVIALEMVNSALETMADMITLERNGKIKKTKDLAAGAVLVAAIRALIVGVIIFIPKIMALYH